MRQFKDEDLLNPGNIPRFELEMRALESAQKGENSHVDHGIDQCSSIVQSMLESAGRALKEGEKLLRSVSPERRVLKVEDDAWIKGNGGGWRGCGDEVDRKRHEALMRDIEALLKDDDVRERLRDGSRCRRVVDVGSCLMSKRR